MSPPGIVECGIVWFCVGHGCEVRRFDVRIEMRCAVEDWVAFVVKRDQGRMEDREDRW